ncbi:MAG TPA: MucB/RseB C-terminal domain-containing protein [Steroidobacter sp.]|nr:MucB/RseB C-terminal domain-containing protein [Steroidobacter sp.]
MVPVSRLLALLLLAAGAAQAGDREAREWLERMSEALATRNYEGRFFHLRDAHAKTMRIIHRVDKGKVSERLVSLDGSGREFIANENEVICYLPDRREVWVEKRDGTLLAGIPNYSEQLEEHYSIERGASTKTLGRRTQLILVQPRDQYRYGYRLWLDHETAMPLKSQLCDHDGNVIEQILFAEVHFRDRIAANALRPSISGEGFRWFRTDDQQIRVADAAMGWSVPRPPAGFRLTLRRIQVIAGSKAPVGHLVYSDGLATVSVFIEPWNPQAEELHGLAKVGAAFAYSRRLNDNQVTVVGEVPAATVEAIAAGVTQGSEPAAPLTPTEPEAAPAH